MGEAATADSGRTRGRAAPAAGARTAVDAEPGSSSPHALVLRGVTAGYRRGRPILRDLDLAVPRGECWAVLGPSGSGKTTLIRVILGVLRPERGTVRLQPGEPNGTGRAGGIGYIPQNLGLVRHRSVRENVLLGCLDRLGSWRALTGRFPEAEAEAADEALRRVGLGGRGGERIERLSGGERRRVAVARALLQRPRLLLADEFLAEVDRVAAAEIVALLRQLRRDTGMTLLFVDHDVENACRIADRVVVLAGGRKVRELSAGEVDPSRVGELFRAGA